MNKLHLNFIILLYHSVYSDDCKAPLTLRISSFGKWSGLVDSVIFFGPNPFDQINYPSIPSIVDRVQDISIWRYSAPIVIGLKNACYNGVNGFIASVSWNGKSIPGSLTGTADSIWKYTAKDNLAQDGWDTLENFDDSSWSYARTDYANSGLASYTSNENYNIRDYVSANGNGQSNASWVGSDLCNEGTTTYMRLVIPASSMPNRNCINSNDVSYIIGSTYPFTGYDFGVPTPQTKVMNIIIAVDDDWDLNFAGRIIVGPTFEDYSETPFSWSRITKMNFNIIPGKYVFAIHAKDLGGKRGFIASLNFDGTLFAVSDGLSQWKISPRPSPGWDTDFDFDDSSLNDSLICNRQADWWNVQPIVSYFGGCPQWMWYPNCVNDNIYTDVYIRFTFDLENPSPAPLLSCSDYQQWSEGKLTLTKSIKTSNRITSKKFSTTSTQVYSASSLIASLSTITTYVEVDSLTISEFSSTDSSWARTENGVYYSNSERSNLPSKTFLIIVGILIFTLFIAFGSFLAFRCNRHTKPSQIIKRAATTTTVKKSLNSSEPTNFNTLFNTNIGLSDHLFLQQDFLNFAKVKTLAKGGQAEINLVKIMNEKLSLEINSNIAVQKVFTKSALVEGCVLHEVSIRLC